MRAIGAIGGFTSPRGCRPLAVPWPPVLEAQALAEGLSPRQISIYGVLVLTVPARLWVGEQGLPEGVC